MHSFVDIFNICKILQNKTIYFYSDTLCLFDINRLYIRSGRVRFWIKIVLDINLHLHEGQAIIVDWKLWNDHLYFISLLGIKIIMLYF